MNEVVDKPAKDKFCNQSLVVAVLVLLNVGLLIVDRILGPYCVMYLWCSMMQSGFLHYGNEGLKADGQSF